ncbi:amidohydrolase [Caproiciproducens sp. NJN-50]|uniref:amidohydrolase family protein n=1 Tax=Acutalibacteraceae TaxID=3082771 RepID=UPI000FFE0ACC|nr:MULTISPECIES: amidohydrolase family protein [Acutalibacteraceae]QAT50374.1 amidohydrolase [Caproiciproducens sp. NJN-50]
MLFDMHAHMFSDKIAEKALSRLALLFGDQPITNGTVGDTEQKMKEWGITAFTALNIATKPGQQKVINDWAASVQTDSVLCFGTVHPDAPDAAEEVLRIARLGLHGIKLHPDSQKFLIAEPRLYPIYEAASSLGLPITFHVGRDPDSVRSPRAAASGITRISRLFPNLTIIAAHMGGARMSDEAEQVLAGKNVYLDTSLSNVFCPPEQFVRIVRKHGSERILFGSDCPWQSPLEEFRWIEHLDLPSADRENIYWNNAVRILKIAK